MLEFPYKIVFLYLKIVFVLTDSAEHDEMPMDESFQD